MLKEIKEINEKIEQHSENIDMLHIKKNELTQVMEKNKNNESYTNPIYKMKLDDIEPVYNENIERLDKKKTTGISNKGLLSLHPIYSKQVTYDEGNQNNNRIDLSEADKLIALRNNRSLNSSIVDKNNKKKPQLNNSNYNDEIYLNKNSGRDSTRNSNKPSSKKDKENEE
jgi:hypothetical protein